MISSDLLLLVIVSGDPAALSAEQGEIATCARLDARAAWLPSPIPVTVPEPPGNLEGNHRLAGARRERQQHPPLAGEDGLDGPVNRNLLVVARHRSE